MFTRTALAQDSAAAVHVKYASGDTELATLTEGVKYFSNRSYELSRIPSELLGLKFTRREGGRSSDLEIEVPANFRVYVLVGSDRDPSVPSPVKSLIARLSTEGWSRLSDAEYVNRNAKHCPIAIFEQEFPSHQHVSVAGAAFAGCCVAAGSLVVDSGGSTAQKQPEPTPATPASTLHTDPTPDTSPIAGPTTRPAIPQTSIRSLEIEETDSGMMLGQTSEVTLTITRGTSPTLTTVRFVTPVGNDMCLARDDALRFIRLTYPNWDVDKAEITFEDKYVPHDGGSIGAAVER